MLVADDLPPVKSDCLLEPIIGLANVVKNRCEAEVGDKLSEPFGRYPKEGEPRPPQRRGHIVPEHASGCLQHRLAMLGESHTLPFDQRFCIELVVHEIPTNMPHPIFLRPPMPFSWSAIDSSAVNSDTTKL